MTLPKMVAIISLLGFIFQLKRIAILKYVRLFRDFGKTCCCDKN